MISLFMEGVSAPNGKYIIFVEICFAARKLLPVRGYSSVLFYSIYASLNIS